MLAQYVDQLSRKFLRLFFIAVRHMSNELDQFAEGDEPSGVGRGCGRLQKDLPLIFILNVLVQEVGVVGLRVSLDFVLKVREVGVDFLESTKFSLAHGNCKGAALLAENDGEQCKRSWRNNESSFTRGMVRKKVRRVWQIRLDLGHEK